jgi:hypothetical protein
MYRAALAARTRVAHVFDAAPLYETRGPFANAIVVNQ